MTPLNLSGPPEPQQLQYEQRFENQPIGRRDFEAPPPNRRQVFIEEEDEDEPPPRQYYYPPPTESKKEFEFDKQIIIICFAAFFVGFLLGSLKRPIVLKA